MMIRLLLTLSAAAFAHDLYLMPAKFSVTPGETLRVAFENGDGFPAGDSSVKPERLRDTRLHSNSGQSEFTGIIEQPKRTAASVRAPGEGTAILTARTIPNFIELDAAKFRSYLEHENLQHIVKLRDVRGESAKPGRERYSKYVKSLITVGRGDEHFKHRTGLTIEIIPEADPAALRVGDRIPVQVLFRGQPAGDIAVESAWLANGKAKMEVIGRTDRDGRISIPILGSGPHRLHAIVMERCADEAAADWESFWASLTFAVPSSH
ncbi:MAG: DUF4198 domain-containing protein [Acidobacteria bacterium]|nr:DUF4198 domain-containing protein [Acidobacteriota bacterium]